MYLFETKLELPRYHIPSVKFVRSNQTKQNRHLPRKMVWSNSFIKKDRGRKSAKK